MAGRKKIFNRLKDNFESLDASSRQAGLALLMRECGFFETVFNAVDDGILVIDRELHLRYFNRAAKELLALPENTSLLRLSQLLPDINWQQIVPEDAANWDRVSRQELQILYPEPRFLQFYLTPLGEGSDAATVILRDVTESRRRATSDLERETVKAVSQLAAGVAHEIGNPLNSLSMNLQILERGFDDPGEALAPEDAAKMIRRCESEVERLDSIIHSFLTAIRPGKSSLTPVDLRETVFEVLNFMRPEIEARMVAVNCQWADNIPKIKGDAEQLKQAFYNIIRNAVQAMSNGGRLDIYGYYAGEFCILEFSDSGKGMNPDDLREMFVPFKTAKAGGNGIGTMIIERVCREHGAELGVVSAEGRGTVFQIRFPDGRRRVRMLPGN
ncbi:MAG: PAS domain-containing protein [Lentisphaerae bacterium]|nr:PAS domain-containing protein [Lentisphaerota bacterium]